MNLRIVTALLFAASLSANAQESVKTPVSRQTLQAVVMPVGNDTTIYPVHAKVNYTTVIILPQGDRILDYLIGDKSAWVLEGAENFAYIRPAEANHRTNMNLITAKGNVYTFDVDEVTSTPSVAVDEKVILRLPQEADLSSSSANASHHPEPRFVAYSDYQAAKLAVQNTAAEAQKAIERDRQNVANSMHFVYKYKPGKPFYITSVYNDGKFTYIQMDTKAQEKPALYLLKDGKPELTNYTFNNGVYVIDSVVDHGYLRLGKAKLDFVNTSK
jgi:type IV secretory pathway VirB9-like protein